MYPKINISYNYPTVTSFAHHIKVYEPYRSTTFQNFSSRRRQLLPRNGRDLKVGLFQKPVALQPLDRSSRSIAGRQVDVLSDPLVQIASKSVNRLRSYGSPNMLCAAIDKALQSLAQKRGRARSTRQRDVTNVIISGNVYTEPKVLHVKFQRCSSRQSAFIFNFPEMHHSRVTQKAVLPRFAVPLCAFVARCPASCDVINFLINP